MHCQNHRSATPVDRFLGMKNFIRSTDEVHLAGSERYLLQKRTFFVLGATIGFVAIVCRAMPQIDDSQNQVTE